MTKIKSADNPTPNKIVLNEIVTCPEDNGERTDDPMQSVKNKTNTSTKQCQRLKRGVDVFIVLPNVKVEPHDCLARGVRKHEP
jgi:hypothetical protein